MVEGKRRAVRHLPVAVAVAVHVAEHVEEGLRPGRVVVEQRGAEIRVVPGHRGRQHRVGAHRLALVEDADLLVEPKAHGDGAAKRHPFRGKAAEDIGLAVDRRRRVEGGVGGVGDFVGGHVHALPRQVGRELSPGKRDIGEFLGQRPEVIVLAVQEREPARLRLVDDVDLDAPDDRKPASQQVRVDGVARRVRAGIAIEEFLAIAGIRLEHDARAAHPFGDAKGTGAHGVEGDVFAVALHHLPGQRGRRRHGEHIGERVVGAREPDADRVAVRRLQSLDGPLVVEAPRFLRRVHGGVRPEDLALDEEEPLAAQLRVEQALDGIDVVVGRQFARLAAERGVRSEEDAGPQPEREGGALVAHLGRPCRVADELRGPREEVVGEQGIEDRLRDAARGLVGFRRRVELRFRAGVGGAHDLARVRLRVRGCSEDEGEEDGGESRQGRAGVQCSVWGCSASSSSAPEPSSGGEAWCMAIRHPASVRT